MSTLPPTPEKNNPRASALRYLEATVVLALFVPTGLFVLEAAQRYNYLIENARIRLSSDVEVAAQHALRIFDTTDVLLQRSADLIGHSETATLKAREAELHQELKRMTSPLEHVHSMWVFDREGKPVVSNRFFPTPVFDVSDREYFQWHLAGKGPTFVTEALIARVGGDFFFDVSRRRLDSNGGFNGLISVGLRPDHIAAFYKELVRDRKGGQVALIRSDGRYVARWPSLPPPDQRVTASEALLKRWAGDARHGVFDGDSVLDGSGRLGAFFKVGDYPLYVYASIPRREVVAEWRREMTVLAAFAVPVSFLLAWIAWLARQRTRAQLIASQKLQEETAHRLQVEETARQAQKLEAMGRLTGGVAHDFNNLLSVVAHNTFLLKSSSLNADARAQAIARLERAVESGTSLTRQLLSFTRRQALRPEIVSLQESLPALADMLQTAMGSRIRCLVSVEPDTAAIEVDSAEMELALLNLAVNARDASPHGGTVTINASNAPPGEGIDNTGPGVVIKFADTGKGIDPALLDRAFEPFFTTKSVGEGTGLGLSQVHGFCTRAGGTARIESELGRGTTVRLYLPAVPHPATPVARDSQAHPEALQCKVLLVDDNNDLVKSTGPMLESIGCHVRVAGSVEQAMSILARGPIFDVVLSDIVMPGPLDGIAFAEALRRSYPDMPVVLMTGYSAQLESARAQDFTVLPKPCSPQVLVQALRRAIQSPALSG